MSCNCVKIELTVERYRLQYNSEIYGSGTLFLTPRGKKNQTLWFTFTLNTTNFVIWYDSTNQKWVVQSGNTPDNGGTIHLHWLNVTQPIIQNGSIAPGQWVTLTGVFVAFQTFFSFPQTYINSVNVAGQFLGNNYYQWQIEGVDFYLYFLGTQWEIGWTLGGTNGQSFGAVKNSPPPCPPLTQSPVWILGEGFSYVKTENCDTYLIECLNFCYSIDGGPTQCIDVNIYDIDGNDAPEFVFTLPEFPGETFKILLGDYGAPFFFGWYLITLGPAGDVVAYLENDGSFVAFPNSGTPNVYGWSQNTYFDFTTSQAKSCPVKENSCDCGISFDFTINGNPLQTITAEASGVYNDRNYFQFEVEFTPGLPVIVYCFWNGVQWDISDSLGGSPIARLYENAFCPIGNPAPIEPDSFLGYWLVIGDNNYLKTEGVSCTTCGREDRIFRQYDALKLPDDTTEPKRGLKDCCCENLVLASNSSKSWENDKTSAWIKLTAGATSTFKLLKDGEETNYTPTPQLFVNEANAIYTTINWNDVLISDGPGCYELVINYNISGIIGQVVWGNYKLLPYTIENARKTARVRAIFNGYHETEQINFTGSNVESSHRFYGFIGNRQPNTEIDNLIYNDRQMKRVIRENLNQYEILTDPLDECQLEPLIDVYLLSENELFISDYNAHNYSYKINDLPVILEESAEINYNEFSRKASLKAIVGDKFKNKRTYFDK
jgi:hypothetical protein